jgi:hypothetical protein
LARPELLLAAHASARGLFRYAVPRRAGVAWLGQPGLRLSADLWSGSAGMLLALCQLTDPTPFALDALDALDERQPSALGTPPHQIGEEDCHGRSPAVAG